MILLLDVGPSMHGVLLEVKNVCLTLVHKKLVYNRSDEVGIVLFGTKGNLVLPKGSGGSV